MNTNTKYVNHVHMDSTVKALPHYYKSYSTSNNDIRVSVYPSNLKSMVRVNEKYETGVYLPQRTPEYTKTENLQTFIYKEKKQEDEGYSRGVKQIIPSFLSNTMRNEQPRANALQASQENRLVLSTKYLSMR